MQTRTSVIVTTSYVPVDQLGDGPRDTEHANCQSGVTSARPGCRNQNGCLSDREVWVNTTHDWSADVDVAHLAAIRRDANRHAIWELPHLVLEVLAYADDEAEDRGRRGSCSVTIHADGSVSVADDGRGTDTRFDERGVPIKKDVIATKDMRFFDAPERVYLPDGEARRGMSVVAALSRWLVHTNRRQDGAWTQRYEYGIASSDLVPLPPTASTGTTTTFLVDDDVLPAQGLLADRIRAVADFPWLCIEFLTE